MHVNYSVVDGLKVILGGWVLHVAALITIIAYGRPPGYDDPEKERKSELIFIQLVILHSGFALATFYDMLDYKKLISLNVLGIIFEIIVIIQICQDWFFLPVEDTTPISELTKS